MSESQQINLRIDGMHCGSCVRRVTQALGALEGVQVQEVRLGAARFASTGSTPVASALEAIHKLGFSAHLEQ